MNERVNEIESFVLSWPGTQRSLIIHRAAGGRSRHILDVAQMWGSVEGGELWAELAGCGLCIRKSLGSGSELGNEPGLQDLCPSSSRYTESREIVRAVVCVPLP